ncbi:MAG TPA: SDR family oxidoreductase, partial [Cytophagales bacterium]|nr:SDR family oxidoreductase [Cytophagales bacterium]
MAGKNFHDTDLSNFSFLVTGGAGFIGSNIVDYLVKNNAKKVFVLDNLATGFQRNLSQYIHHPKVTFIQGDIRDKSICLYATQAVDYVFHQAALGSVPRSIHDPLTTNQVNVDGFLNVLDASKENGVKRLIYASSSSVYGSDKLLPKQEDKVGSPLSPYAVTKKTNELYAEVYYKTYGFENIGLRYFNIFGPNQSPEGEYAALIPRFIKAILLRQEPTIYGDGEQARDFTYIANAVEANMKALFAPIDAVGQVYNVAVGDKTSVNELFQYLKDIAGVELKARYGNLRPGEIRDSLADISKAKVHLGYVPSVSVKEGLKHTYEWFLQNKELLNIK